MKSYALTYAYSLRYAARTFAFDYIDHKTIQQYHPDLPDEKDYGLRSIQTNLIKKRIDSLLAK